MFAEFRPDSIILCNEKFCYRNFNLLSFDKEAEEDDEESVILNKKFSVRFRLRSCGRCLIAMANAGEDNSGSQFFFTLGSQLDLQNKHSTFGYVTEETIYDMLELEEALVDENDKPLYAPKMIKAELLNNPFSEIIPRIIVQESEEVKDRNKPLSTSSSIEFQGSPRIIVSSGLDAGVQQSWLYATGVWACSWTGIVCLRLDHRDDSVLPDVAGIRSVCLACKAPPDPRIDFESFIGSGTNLGPRVSLGEYGSGWTWTRHDREGAEA
ncbi:Peptidyl-prolyl cis-trans isomerase CWC27 like protein [Eufriesea mexicana]|nr:Peptidyl-prolyl cis-trans isomerase CWC27 like protein [Eufriesea mexicana]